MEFIEQLLTVYEYASLRHFDEGRLFITQISPKGNWEIIPRRGISHFVYKGKKRAE